MKKLQEKSYNISIERRKNVLYKSMFRFVVGISISYFKYSKVSLLSLLVSTWFFFLGAFISMWTWQWSWEFRWWQWTPTLASCIIVFWKIPSNETCLSINDYVIGNLKICKILQSLDRFFWGDFGPMVMWPFFQEGFEFRGSFILGAWIDGGQFWVCNFGMCWLCTTDETRFWKNNMTITLMVNWMMMVEGLINQGLRVVSLWETFTFCSILWVWMWN